MTFLLNYYYLFHLLSFYPLPSETILPDFLPFYKKNKFSSFICFPLLFQKKRRKKSTFLIDVNWRKFNFIIGKLNNSKIT